MSEVIGHVKRINPALETALKNAFRTVAQRDSAKVLCLTAQPDGRTAKASDGVLLLPAQTMADDEDTQAGPLYPWAASMSLRCWWFLRSSFGSCSGEPENRLGRPTIAIRT